MSNATVMGKIRTLISIATNETTGIEEARTAAVTAVKMIQSYNIRMSLPSEAPSYSRPNAAPPPPSPPPPPPPSPRPNPRQQSYTTQRSNSKSKRVVEPVDTDLDDIAAQIHEEVNKRRQARRREPVSEDSDFNKNGEYVYATSRGICSSCKTFYVVGDIVFRSYSGDVKHKLCSR